jgi:hypothetical protein
MSDKITFKTDGEERFYIDDDAVHMINMPKTKWTVQIPKGGELHIYYKKELNWWVRLWMRFIGWGVTKGDV